MRIRKAISAVMLILLCLLTVSCSGRNDIGGLKKETGSSLNINLYGPVQRAINGVSAFKMLHEDVKLNIKEFDNYEEYKNKTAAELLAGEGPDVVFVQSFDEFGVKKHSTQDIFYDLNKLIAQDKDFHIEEYNEKIMNCGVYKSKRLLIPLGYTIPAFYTIKGNLEKNNIVIPDESLTLKEFVQVAEQYKKGNKSKDLIFNGPIYPLSDIINQNINYFVDYENKKTSFNTKTFIDIMKQFKGILDATYTSNGMVEGPTSLWDVLSDNAILAYRYDNSLTFHELWSRSSSVKRYLNEVMLVYTMPSPGDKRHIYAEPIISVGINSGSKNKNTAFDYVKFLLSEQMQEELEVMWALPVRSETYEKQRDICLTDKGIRHDSGDYESAAVPIAIGLTKKADELVKKIDVCEMGDNTICQMVLQELGPFFGGKRTAEEAAKIIDEKVTLYLNE